MNTKLEIKQWSPPSEYSGSSLSTPGTVPQHLTEVNNNGTILLNIGPVLERMYIYKLGYILKIFPQVQS
jgi:hypothetical protein